VALGNLASRFLVAVVAAPILLVLIYWGRPEPFWLLIFVASILAMHEFFTMTLADAADRRAVLVIGSVATAELYWLHPASLGMSERALAFGITGIVYAGFMTVFVAMAKRNLPAGPDIVVLIFLIAWVGDTGAYFAGRFLGTKKLYPDVSPKKTWAGAIGGLLGSVVAAGLMKVLRLDAIIGWVDVFLIAIPAAILGQLGDLAESLLKRSVGVKDSGSLLPGHGGILDRIDAVIFIAPYVALYAMLALRAV
jgi:phosphatidate cytidylyltransferase